MKTDILIERVCKYFDTTTEILYSYNKKRTREYLTIRQFIFYFLRKHTNMSYKKIGEIFGQNHATVLNGVRTITDLIETCNKIQVQYIDLTYIANEVFKFKHKSVKRKLSKQEVYNLVSIALGNACMNDVKTFYEKYPDVYLNDIKNRYL